MNTNNNNNDDDDDTTCKPEASNVDEIFFESAKTKPQEEFLRRKQLWTLERLELRKKITDLVESVVESVHGGQLPRLIIKKDSWKAVNLDTGVLRSDNKLYKCSDYTTVTKAERFSRTMIVLRIIYGLLVRNELSTVRQIFYDNVKVFEHQANVSAVLADITRLLDCSRRDLNVVPTAKGLACGNLRWRFYGSEDWVDCQRTPILIPNDFRAIDRMESSANVVVVIEKDAVFQKLLDQSALSFLKACDLDVLFITGKGMPDLCTRKLLYVLSEFIAPKAKYFILTDADAYGIEIAAVFSFGSLAQASSKNFGVPSVHWLGLWPSEIEKYDMSLESRIDSSALHMKRLKSLLSRPWMKLRPDWVREVATLISLQCRAEIQALDQFGYNFLLKKYILSKLRDNGPGGDRSADDDPVSSSAK